MSLEDCVAPPSEMSGAVAVAPSAMVDYEEGNVISSTLIKRGGGAITLFAFDEGQSLSEHTASFDAVAHVLEGEADIIIGGVPIAATAGNMVLMPAKRPHAVHARTRVKMLVTTLRSA
jgi:quercetin dioxygenase-like cupin family protein